MIDEILKLRGARVYDLAQPYYVGMPHYPTHPPFLFGLTKQHGDYVGPRRSLPTARRTGWKA